jgi:hypothetical protein
MRISKFCWSIVCWLKGTEPPLGPPLSDPGGPRVGCCDILLAERQELVRWVYVGDFECLTGEVENIISIGGCNSYIFTPTIASILPEQRAAVIGRSLLHLGGSAGSCTMGTPVWSQDETTTIRLSWLLGLWLDSSSLDAGIRNEVTSGSRSAW